MDEKLGTILLTGGLGQLGYFTYLKLKHQYNICIVDDLSNAKVEPPEDVQFIKKRLPDEEIFEKLPDIDFIIHLAAQISIKKSIEKPIYDANSNIYGTLDLLEYARKKDIKKFIYISSAGTFGNPQYLPIDEKHPRTPISPYGLSKLVGENYVKMYDDLYGLNTVSLIPFNFYSPLQNENDPYAGVIFKFLTAVKCDSNLTIFGDGKQTRDFIHIKDVARALELALITKTSSKTFNIGSGKATSIVDLANMVLQISNKNLDITFQPAIKGEIKESYCSIERAAKELDFSPRISLHDGLKDMYGKIIL